MFFPFSKWLKCTGSGPLDEIVLWQKVDFALSRLGSTPGGKYRILKVGIFMKSYLKNKLCNDFEFWKSSKSDVLLCPHLISSQSKVGNILF